MLAGLERIGKGWLPDGSGDWKQSSTLELEELGGLACSEIPRNVILAETRAPAAAVL